MLFRKFSFMIAFILLLFLIVRCQEKLTVEKISISESEK
jgi:hypothetical protein